MSGGVGRRRGHVGEDVARSPLLKVAGFDGSLFTLADYRVGHEEEKMDESMIGKACFKDTTSSYTKKKYEHVGSRLHEVPRRLKHLSQRQTPKSQGTRKEKAARSRQEKSSRAKWSGRGSYLEARRRRQQYREQLVELILHRDPWDDESGVAATADAPLTTREKDTLRYYYYIHNGIASKLVAPLSTLWWQRILHLVPNCKRHARVVSGVGEEVEQDYLFAVKKSIVDFVLNEPEIEEDERFLDENDETEVTLELARVSDAWKRQYRLSRNAMQLQLHVFKEPLQSSKKLWQQDFQHLTLLNLQRNDPTTNPS